MQPNKPQSNYSKKPIRKIRLLKIGPRKSKSLFEEYFYGFAIAISLVVMILGKAGGLSGYEAIVTGLWVGGFMWAAWVFRSYRKEQASPGKMEKSKQVIQPRGEMIANPRSANFKPMIGPQSPGPAGQTPAAPEAPSNPGKRAFVYERPTLPDRKPKFPANWAGKPDKKPKQ